MIPEKATLRFSIFIVESFINLHEIDFIIKELEANF